MRGKLAKLLRANCVVDGVVDRVKLKKLKRIHMHLRRKQEPKLEKNPRWYRSPLHRAKMTKDGLHFARHKPLEFIGPVFIDLDDNGKKAALHLVKVAERLSKPELREKIRYFKETYVIS